nr:MAG TPA: hypothetical protein [Caudoviricetes sp.]
MKLTEKEFIKTDGTVIKLTPEWISTKLGEVYELSHLDKIDQERLHYGYMTEALVSFLETTDEKGVPFFERVELKSIDVGNNRICNLLNQRIIFDKPSKIERENFYHDFNLWPTIYSDEKKIDDIVVKVHSEFALCNREGDLELYFNDNLVELNVFELINSDNKKEIYHFTFEDNVASSVIISEMNQPFWTNNKALDNIDVAFEAKKEASIVLESSAINMMVDDRENFTFKPIKVGDHLSLIDSQITFDRESLKNREVELDFDFLYLKDSSISFEGVNSQKVGLRMRKIATFNSSEITCVDYSVINKTIDTNTIGEEVQKTRVRFENATIDSGVSYYSNVKYDSSVFEIINSKIENEGDEILSLANGISITNSTVKNTLKLANVLIENADIDNLVLENKGKDHDSFLVQTSTVDGDKKSQGRITLNNCVVNVDDYFSISVHGNFSASNSNFFGINNFYSSLEDDHLLRIRSDINLDINIVNSNFKNAKVYAIGLLTNKEWQNPDYRQTLAIYGSELTGENELRETTLVLNSILQNVTLANASEIRNSFLKEIAKSYEMPTLIEGQNLTADELKKDVGQIANEIEAL